MQADQIRSRIQAVQRALAAHQLAACVVPSSDPHVSEYLPERWQSRRWLSGFSGSMGTLVVTQKDAHIFADSRYWEQAEKELADTGISLKKIANGMSLEHVDWLASVLSHGDTVAVDAAVCGVGAARHLQQSLGAHGITLRTDFDVVNEVWPDRPALPVAPVTEHVAPHAVETRAARLSRVRAAMQQHSATHHLVSSLDDIAWIFNLRGSDVPYNPVFVAHALIAAGSVTLFVGEGKIRNELAAALKQDGVTLAPYAAAHAALAAIPAASVMLLDPRRVTLAQREALPAAVRVIEAINPSTLFKSQKSDAEAAHVRQAMELDGAAMCEFYAWLEQALGHEHVSELTIDERINAARAKRGAVGPSFATIAGFNANGALPHYRATQTSHALISSASGLAANGLLLIDSGGQYPGGTTDITRVWPVGTTSAQHKRDFTRVLKGTIALSRIRFPRGTLSPMLDAIARAPLWAHGLDYGHGTGHGVGYFLNVHEGPQSISRAIPEPHMAMEPGMITSIEPGLYRPGKWGIRIENLVLNVPAFNGQSKTEFGDFLEFETLTLCPIDARCIDVNLMSVDEVDWLNAYHVNVRERLSKHVSGDAKAWLEARTQAIAHA